MNYITEWLHLYSIHFGAVVALLMFLDLYKNGLPLMSGLIEKGKVALVLAAFIAVFSSHAHNHFLYHIIKEIK